MTHFNKLKIPSLLNWVSSNLKNCCTRSPENSNLANGYYPIVRFYGTKIQSLAENDSKFCGSELKVCKKDFRVTPGVRRKAQAALREYLHSTSGLEFTVADFISHNSPCFVENLLKKVESDQKVEEYVARLLRYHPINEYEPFFESMGLKPFEYASFLPRDLMYLNDDAILMENYHVLCNYGVPRGDVGRIYKKANEVFRYDFGVLKSKIRAFEEMGLGQSSVIRFISSCPNSLIGEKNTAFLKILEKLKDVGIDFVSIEDNLLEWDSYSWRRIFWLISFLSNTFGSDEKLCKLVKQNPGVLFESSANSTFSFIGFLLKFGYTKDDLCSVISQLSRVEVKTFACNLRGCYQFLLELEMGTHEIGKIVHSHPLMLGSCSLKKLTSLLANLNTGKKNVCTIIKENPQVLKNWVIGTKLEPVQNYQDPPHIVKAKFLLDLGLDENSVEFERTLKQLKGKGEALQERFDCFVRAGMSKQEVIEIIKASPRILNQSVGIIEMKIDFLFNELGYPLSALKGFPVFVNYGMERVKLRFSMYDWLKEQGRARSDLTLSTILACSDKEFIRQFVNAHHPQGPQVWENLKRRICPNSKGKRPV